MSYASLRDGRNLFYKIYGDPHGTPVVFFHGFPGSHLQGEFADEEAKKQNVQVICFDRPGLGNSDYKAERKLDEIVHDVEDLLNLLQHPRAGLIGVSGGAPFAMACAHAMPERFTSLALVCPVGPASEKDFWRHYKLVPQLGFTLSKVSPKVLRFLYTRFIRRYDRNPEYYLGKFSRKLSSEDQRITSLPEVQLVLKRSLKHSYRQNPAHAIEDLVIFATKWKFKLNQIKVPTTIYQGLEDRIIPPEIARVLAREIPESKLQVFAEDGHYSLPIRRLPEIIRNFRDKQIYRDHENLK